jgi:hypothetical protein
MPPAIAVLPGACRALVHDRLAHLLENRERTVEVGLFAAHHDGEPRLARADVAAGNRCIQNPHTPRFRFGGESLGQRRAGGGHVDEQSAGFGGCEDAVGLAVHLFHVGGITDHRDDDVGMFRGLSGSRGPTRTGGDQFVRLGLRACVNEERMAGGHEVAGHAAAHDSGTDERDGGK